MLVWHVGRCSKVVAHLRDVAVCRDGLAGVARVQRGLAAVSMAEEWTEGWWVALVCVLGQPSEVRRRAAWEAVAGTAVTGAARLEWAEVEARVRAVETRLVGSAGALGAGGAVRVWTEEEVVETAARGGEVDLGGMEVELTRVVVVKGVNKAATIRNGTLRVSTVNAEMGNGLALVVENGGGLRLECMRVVGTGVSCKGGGRVTLVDTHLTDAPMLGVASVNAGSKVVVHRGCIAGAMKYHGVFCGKGGQVELVDVEIADCKNSGVVSVGQGSKVVMQGGRITGSKEEHGVGCQEGGQVELRGVEVADCKGCGVVSLGQGSKVVMRGGCITGSKEEHGVGCKMGGYVELRDVEVADCKMSGVISQSQGSKAVMQGGCITGCKEGFGLGCREGGHAEVRDVVIRDCNRHGLYCDSVSTLRHSGCTVSGCGLGSQDGC